MPRAIKTGGNWNPNERNVFFLAGSKSSLYAAFGEQGNPNMHKWLLIAVNEMDDTVEDFINKTLPYGVNWLIDSGIFNLTNEHKRRHGITMDEALALSPEEIDGFDALFDRYVRLLEKLKDKCWGYIELDQGGRENKIRIRARLESMGFRPIPVYHPLNDGWDYFDYLAQRYDRICLGNIVQADKQTRLRLAATIWERKRAYPNLWVHGLGYTPNEYLNAYPLDSCDSSAWLGGVRWGGQGERACMRSFYKLPRNFLYRLGEGDGPAGQAKAVQMGAYVTNLHLRTWRDLIAEFGALGAEVYPPLIKEVKPGRAA